jgi:hypothetical protein
MRQVRTFVVLALVTVAAVAVGESHAQQRVAALGARIAVWPSEICFDTVDRYATAFRTVTVRNLGDSTLPGYHARPHWGDNGHLTVPNFTSTPIAPGDSDHFELQFYSADTGTYVMFLDVKALRQWLVLRCTAYCRGTPPPPPPPQAHASISPPAFDFDSAAVGTQALRQVTVRNTGDSAILSIRSQIISGRGFSLVKPAGASVNPGDSTLATIMYAPITAGPDSGSFRIETNDPAKPAISIPLRGRCLPVPGPRLYCAGNALFMSMVKYASGVDSVLIYNIGSSDLVLSSQAIVEDTLEFVIIREARSPLAPQDSAAIVIRFTDRASTYGKNDYHYGVLRLVTNDPAKPIFDLPLVTEAFNTHADPLPGVPSVLALHQNYPNPFSASRMQGTTLEFDLAEAATVRLAVYSSMGRRVAVLDEARHEAGRYRCRWNPDGLPPGLYIAVLSVATRTGAPVVLRVRMICTN